MRRHGARHRHDRQFADQGRMHKGYAPVNYVVACRTCSSIVAFPAFPGLYRVSCPNCGSQVYPPSSGDQARAASMLELEPAIPECHPLERRWLSPEENERARRLLASVEGL